jgi:hypothetical protein
MDKLLESYKTLGHLGSQVRLFIDIHNTCTENKDYLNEIRLSGHYEKFPLVFAVTGSLLNYAILIASSFFDEYNEEFTPFKHPEYRDRILKLKTITKPVLKRLGKWVHFKDYRNYILAHGFRFKDKSMFDKDFKLFKFNAPHTNSEIILLSELIRVVTICISSEFPELVANLDMDETILSKMDFYWNEIDVQKEVESIWTQIDLIKRHF